MVTIIIFQLHRSVLFPCGVGGIAYWMVAFFCFIDQKQIIAIWENSMNALIWVLSTMYYQRLVLRMESRFQHIPDLTGW